MEHRADDELTYLGRCPWQDGHPLLGITRADRRFHAYVIGKSGVGKSTLLATLIIQDLKLGEGCALVDPHGDLAERILDYVPSWRVNDVVYFNPADAEYPVSFNLLETEV